MSGVMPSGSDPLGTWTAGRIAPPSDFTQPAPDATAIGRWSITALCSPQNDNCAYATYNFKADGTFSFEVWYGTSTGRWTQRDDAIEWVFGGYGEDKTHFTGTVDGDRMSGTKRNTASELGTWAGQRLPGP